MHPSCLAWCKRIIDDNGLASLRTLEVGSMNINGTVRQFFTGPYWGIDITPGPMVDQVQDAEDLSDMPTYEVVISTEVLEHVRRPWRAMQEMADVCEPGGHVIITARGYDERGCWEVHGFPQDYWRVSHGAMQVMAEDAGLTVQEITADPEGPGFFLYARK
jgi:SAM-dependent methyltransferase